MSEQLKLDTLNGFSEMLKRYEKSLALLLQSKYGISPEEFYVSAVNAIKETPKLLQCDPRTLFGAILLSAECGLRFNTPEQLAFILPYGKVAKFQIGYKGLVEMMYRSPRVSSIYAEVVYEKDTFDYGYGLNPFLNHIPYRQKDRGGIDCVYAVCKLKDAEPIFTVVEKHILDEIKKFSPNNTEHSARNNGKDVHDFMEIKAGIKKISKLIPKASIQEVSRAIDYDSKLEGGGSVIANLPVGFDDIITPMIIDGQSESMLTVFDDVTLPDKVEAKQNKPVQKPKEKEMELEFNFEKIADPKKDTGSGIEFHPREEK